MRLLGLIITTSGWLFIASVLGFLVWGGTHTEDATILAKYAWTKLETEVAKVDALLPWKLTTKEGKGVLFIYAPSGEIIYGESITVPVGLKLKESTTRPGMGGKTMLTVQAYILVSDDMVKDVYPPLSDYGKEKPAGGSVAGSTNRLIPNPKKPDCPSRAFLVRGSKLPQAKNPCQPAHPDPCTKRRDKPIYQTRTNLSSQRTINPTIPAEGLSAPRNGNQPIMFYDLIDQIRRLN